MKTKFGLSHFGLPPIILNILMNAVIKVSPQSLLIKLSNYFGENTTKEKFILMTGTTSGSHSMMRQLNEKNKSTSY